VLELTHQEAEYLREQLIDDYIQFFFGDRKLSLYLYAASSKITGTWSRMAVWKCAIRAALLKLNIPPASPTSF